MCFAKCVCVFDSEGTFNPSFDNECSMGLEADAVILAIGQSTDLGFAMDEGVAVSNYLLKVDDKTLETNVKGIFAGGANDPARLLRGAEVVADPATTVASARASEGPDAWAAFGVSVGRIMDGCAVLRHLANKAAAVGHLDHAQEEWPGIRFLKTLESTLETVAA